MNGVVDFVSDPVEVWATYETYRGGLAFDVGANGGMTSRIFAPNFERVVAFEPCVESFVALTEDCPPNVTPMPVALADRAGLLTLERTDVLVGLGELKLGDSMERIWGPTTETRTVPAMTLDSATDMFGPPDFVKIDTEGSEAIIVEGGIYTFRECQPRFVIEVHAAANGEQILETLDDYNITLFRHPAYKPTSSLYADHYYLIGEPS